MIAAFLAALTSSSYAQSPVNQPLTKKPSIRQICTERLDAYGLRGSVRNKYWWHCWRRRGR